MACNHKFIEYLNLAKLDFEPTTLIVGTFNPAVDGNKAEWFYGRFDNNFWDVLPRLYKEPSMRCSQPGEWKAFCKRHQIAITDLISSIADADMDNPIHLAQLKTYSDKSIAEKFKKHKFVEIAELLRSNPTIKNVYLTRGTSHTFWKKAWEPVKKYAKENGIREHKLMTPSRNARFQNKKNKLNPLRLEDFILAKWKEEWHEI